MITINSEINIISGDNGVLTAVSSNNSPSEFSSDIGSILGSNKTAIEGTPTTKVDYFIGSALSNGNGVFSTPFELVLSSSVELSALTIQFDTTNNRHPNSISFYTPETSLEEQINESAVAGTRFDKAFVYNRPIKYAEVISGIGTVSIDRTGMGMVYSELVGQIGMVVATINVVFEEIYQSTIVDDDAIFTMTDLPKPNDGQYTIRIADWNEPFSSVVITGIYIPISIKLDKRNLISSDRTIYDRGDIKLPSYGIISNVGNIEFNDSNGEVKDYAEQLLLTSDLKVVMNIVNTLTGASEQLDILETANWNYNNDNRSVSVSLKDDLEEWQDIYIEGFNYDPRNAKSVLPNQTMADLYKWLHKRTPSKYNMLSYDELDEKTKFVLDGTFIPYPHLNSGSLWEQWEKICQVCALYIYKNSKGKTACVYTYGS